jgi:hypothetical protein
MIPGRTKSDDRAYTYKLDNIKQITEIKTMNQFVSVRMMPSLGLKYDRS